MIDPMLVSNIMQRDCIVIYIINWQSGMSRSPLSNNQCSNYMQARVCRAPSLLVRAPILSEIFGVQRGPALAPHLDCGRFTWAEDRDYKALTKRWVILRGSIWLEQPKVNFLIRLNDTGIQNCSRIFRYFGHRHTERKTKQPPWQMQ